MSAASISLPAPESPRRWRVSMFELFTDQTMLRVSAHSNILDVVLVDGRPTLVVEVLLDRPSTMSVFITVRRTDVPYEETPFECHLKTVVAEGVPWHFFERVEHDVPPALLVDPDSGS